MAASPLPFFLIIVSQNSMQSNSRKLVIYQMLLRLFGNKTATNRPYGTIAENGVGKFEDITAKALVGIRELGVTHIWYTGVIEHATVSDYSSFGIPPDDPDIVKGRAGSPYAIRDYYDVAPDLAIEVPNRMHEFEDLVTRTHEHGMGVIIDFVPNHVARTYRSDVRPEGVADLGEMDDRSVAFRPDNNFYYLPGQSFVPPADPANQLIHPARDGKFEECPARASGNDLFTASPGPESWYETVKLNYGIDILNSRATYFDPMPDTWKKMRDILFFWADKQVNGFRCDMAEMVPVEFWNWVIPQVKQRSPGIVFIAETYDPAEYRNYLERGKFDLLYDKVLLYDTLRNLVTGSETATRISTVRNQLAGIDHHMLRFMENHDEQRIASIHFAGNPWRGFPAFVVSTTIDRGASMLYFAQEVGESAVGSAGFQRDDGRTTIFDYWGVPEHQKWMNGGQFDGGQLSEDQRELRRLHAVLLANVSASPAISQGDYLDISAHVCPQESAHRIHAFLRYYNDERLLIVAGFNDHELKISVRIPPEAVDAMGMDQSKGWQVRDMLRNTINVKLDKNLSYDLIISPFNCFVFRLSEC